MPDEQPEKGIPWLLAEAERNGKPMLIRAREFPPEMIGNPNFPAILCITFRYEISDPTGLPSREQYAELHLFEKRTLDWFENIDEGFAAYIKTADGAVKYVLYVRDADRAAGLMLAQLHDSDPVEIAIGIDGDWSQYRAISNSITE